LEDIEWLALTEGIFPLLEAIESNSIVDIERELKNAMQVQGFDINHIIDNTGGLIHYAAMFGSDNALELLLANGADINLQNVSQETALHLASQFKKSAKTDVAVVLLDEENINLDIKNNKRQTALDVANEAGNENMKAEILAEIDDRKSVLTVFKKTLNSAVSTIKSLFDSPAEKKEEVTPVVPVQREIKQPDSWSSTNIMNFALSDTQPDVYQNVNKLHQAIRDNDMSVIVELLNAGVDIDHKIDGKCALHVATESANYNLKIVDLLIESGADVNLVDQNGQTLLHLAVTWNDTKLTDFLLDNPLVDVNVQDNVGDTAMHLAFLYQNTDIAELILQKRSEVDLSIVNDDELSAQAIGEFVLGMPADIPQYTPAEPHPLDINLDRTSVGLPNAGLEANDPVIQNDRNRLIN
jgi:ankyrin repeat protein